MPQPAKPAENAPEGTSDPTVVNAIKRAKSLEKQRHSVLQDIDKNRQLLRLLDANKSLTEDEGAWLDDFYPLKEKDTKRTTEEVERTRKAKEAARAES